MTIQLDFATLNLQDALDMAVLIEKEAEDRYLSFVDQLGQRYPGDATNFFGMMARNEQRHGAELSERRRSLFGDTPSRVTKDMIQSDIEAPAPEKAVRYMSPRHALEVAMESEIKAYDFYNSILPFIQDATVRELVKSLRDEEVEHQKLLNEKRSGYADTLESDFDQEIDAPHFFHIPES